MKRNNFTLIELLVVIGIIGILTAILLPAIAGTRRSAFETQAKSELTKIALAVNTYFNDYGHLPYTQSNNDEEFDFNSNISYALFGIDPDVIDPATSKPLRKNVRSIRYYEHDPREQLKNPWGKPYTIILDLNYDNLIEPSITSDKLGGRVGVWTETDENEILVSWGEL